jgi:hypothetical protein
MIALHGDLKILVATQPIDFRNYAPTMIMRSRRGGVRNRALCGHLDSA